MSISRTRIASVAIVAALVPALSGCGFIAAGNKSATKPSGFVLTGQAAVALPASSTATVGSPCQAPAGATDVAPNVTVTVTDVNGKKIGTGTLGAGVVTGSGTALTCSFPFQIPAVPGGDATYNIAVGTRPAQTFPGTQLQQSTPAVITITPSP